MHIYTNLSVVGDGSRIIHHKPVLVVHVFYLLKIAKAWFLFQDWVRYIAKFFEEDWSCSTRSCVPASKLRFVVSKLVTVGEDTSEVSTGEDGSSGLRNWLLTDRIYY